MYSQNQVWQQKKQSHRDRVESKFQPAPHYEPSYSAAPYRPSSRASSVPAYSRDLFRQDASTNQPQRFQKRPSCTSALNTIITNFHDMNPYTNPSNSNQSIVRTIPIQRSAEYLASRTQMKKFPLRDGPLPPSSITITQSKQIQSSSSSTLQSKPLHQQQQKHQKSLTNEPSRSASSERTNSLPRTHLNSVMTISLLPGSVKQSSIPSETPIPRVGKKPAYSRSQSNTCPPSRFLQSDAETVTSVNSETMSVHSDERIKIPEDRRSFIRKSPSLRVGQSSDRSVATYPGGNHPLPKRSSLDVLLAERQSSADSLGKPTRMQVGPTFPGTVARTNLCSPILGGSVRNGRTSVNPSAQLPPQYSLTDSSHSSEQMKLVHKNSEEPHGILKNSKFRFSLPRMRSNAPVLTDMGCLGDSAHPKPYPLRNASSYTSISEKSDIKPMTEIRFERPIRKRVSPKRSGYQTDVDHLNSTNSEDSLTIVRNLPLPVHTIESGPRGSLNHRRIGNSSNPVSPLYSGQGMKDKPRSGSRSFTEVPRSATNSTESSRSGRSMQKSPISLVHISSDPASPRNLSTRSNQRDSTQTQPVSSPARNINTSGLSQPNQKSRSSRSSSRESTNVISKSIERNNLIGSTNASPERKQSPYEKPHATIYYENPISMNETSTKGTVRLASTGTRPTIVDSRSNDIKSRTITMPPVGHVDKVALAQLNRPGPVKLASSTSNDSKAKLSPFRKTSDSGLSTLDPMVGESPK
ncbi:hypothetical protein FBUS_06150 [Fasciolopsis buskii]|uniref:Uncharacterized protein n=1 Tax=Fasciolopsis buskii TaxID=27845 RepID=A0A8E0VNP2_9TREM|nr:hypothetical protein FBUS_06150 [Fasciolopsis buski]